VDGQSDSYHTRQMRHVFEGHVDNPQPGSVADFDSVIENVRLFEAEEDKHHAHNAAWCAPPTMGMNIQLLRDWGAILYPPGHMVVPYRGWSGVIQHRNLKTRLEPEIGGYSEDDLRHSVSEIACEIMGWNIYHGSERGWIICPHVPIRPISVLDPNTFEPVIVFRTSFGWLDKRENP
jgi:hypothetical protein